VGERIVAFFLAFAVLWMVFYFIAKLMRSQANTAKLLGPPLRHQPATVERRSKTTIRRLRVF